MALATLLMCSGLLLSGAGPAKRVQPFRIGALTDSWGPTPYVAGLREGLQALGYREPEQFVIGVRFTQGDVAALPAAARQLVQAGVDLLFVSDAAAAQAAQQATQRIPIIFAWVGDPLALGLIKSFARPGGNITGVTDLRLELSAKRLEIFRDLLPGLQRVLYLYDRADGLSVKTAREYRDAARHLGITLVEQAVGTQEEARTIITQVQKEAVDGILAPASAALNILGFMLEATTRRAIPSLFAAAFMVEQGGLASYGPNDRDMGRQAARLVDKILKGADPAELPVEVNQKIEFVINLKVAHALGLTIAPEVLFRADRLIR
jgi:putative ABC transport system substrate-binding protein